MWTCALAEYRGVQYEYTRRSHFVGPFIIDQMRAVICLTLALAAASVGMCAEPAAQKRIAVLDFCLTGSVKVTCSTGETAVIDAGTGLVMSDVSGKGHKSEVTSADPVTAIIIQ